MMEQNLIAAALVALAGGVHCIGMCGGLVGALALGLPPGGRRWPFLLAYNLGRIASYTAAGALAGGLGGYAAALADVRRGQLVLQCLAGLFMLLLGAYLAGVWVTPVRRLEQGGAGLWRRLQPLAGKLLPIRSLPRALLAGAVWGWLPCGLVYSVLVWALAAGGVVQGAALMLAFGVGTLPTLLVLGATAASLTRYLQAPAARRVSGALVAGFGLWQIGGAVLGLTF